MTIRRHFQSWGGQNAGQPVAIRAGWIRFRVGSGKIWRGKNLRSVVLTLDIGPHGGAGYRHGRTFQIGYRCLDFKDDAWRRRIHPFRLRYTRNGNHTLFVNH